MFLEKTETVRQRNEDRETLNQEGEEAEPVLGNNAATERVKSLLAAVGHLDFGARRARLALLELATHTGMSRLLGDLV